MTQRMRSSVDHDEIEVECMIGRYQWDRRSEQLGGLGMVYSGRDIQTSCTPLYSVLSHHSNKLVPLLWHRLMVFSCLNSIPVVVE